MATGASETSADRYRREVAERFDGVLKQNAATNLVDAVRASVAGDVYVDAGVRPPARSSGSTLVAAAVS